MFNISIQLREFQISCGMYVYFTFWVLHSALYNIIPMHYCILVLLFFYGTVYIFCAKHETDIPQEIKCMDFCKETKWKCIGNGVLKSFFFVLTDKIEASVFSIMKGFIEVYWILTYKLHYDFVQLDVKCMFKNLMTIRMMYLIMIFYQKVE